MHSSDYFVTSAAVPVQSWRHRQTLTLVQGEVLSHVPEYRPDLIRYDHAHVFAVENLQIKDSVLSNAMRFVLQCRDKIAVFRFCLHSQS